MRLHAAGLQVLDDFGFERAANAVQLAQATFFEQHVQALRGVADAAGRGPIRVVAVGRLAFDLEDVADFGEESGNFGVGARSGAAVVGVEIRLARGGTAPISGDAFALP